MKRKQDNSARYFCEVEVTEGLEHITKGELTELFGAAVALVPADRPGELRFTLTGSLGELRRLQTIYAAYVVCDYAVPRPRALLGDAHFRRLLEQIESVRALNPNSYRSFSVAAAGSDSSVMARIKEQIAAQTGLALADDRGDLLIRIRPSNAGWQTLVRVSARPQVTRSWRVCNWEGALNSATGHALIRLGKHRPNDVYLNIGCGSATLLIERLRHGKAGRVIGVDIDNNALQCAQANVTAAGEPAIQLLLGDMTSLPLLTNSVDHVVADLPFGQLSGSHTANVEMYPRALNEAGRVTRANGQFTLITHEMRLLERLLRESPYWTNEKSIQINLRGLHPRIYVLRRTLTSF